MTPEYQAGVFFTKFMGDLAPNFEKQKKKGALKRCALFVAQEYNEAQKQMLATMRGLWEDDAAAFPSGSEASQRHGTLFRTTQ